VIGGDERGRPVVLHGAGFQADTSKQIGTMKELAQASYLAYAIDLPAQGGRRRPIAGTAESPPVLIRAMAQALLLIMQRRGPGGDTGGT
jgi:alpha-beta hydrolase superfamily lysophospholipase